tara:strand:- start:478 stop:1026 length:549 start_codon:yes stop_codon:yes gene_type:complete
MSVVHIITATLRSDSDQQELEHAWDAASTLADSQEVTACHVGRSPNHLVTAVWLSNQGSLEIFAASEPHMKFVMERLAHIIEGMWSVSISVEREPPHSTPDALWAFAIPEIDGVFEWQIERQIDAVNNLPGESWAGRTIEEREQYRAGGVILLSGSEIDDFCTNRETIEIDTLILNSTFTRT